MASLCREGLLGGGLYVKDDAVVFRTNKLTVNKEYRNLCLPYGHIKEISWKNIIFPVAAFSMADGQEYKFIIFNRSRFERCYGGEQNK